MMANALAVVPEVAVTFASRPGPLRERLSASVSYLALPSRNVPPFVATAYALRKIIRQEQPEIVHVHGARLALVTHYALQLSGHRAPLVMTHHSRGFGGIPTGLAGRLLTRSCTELAAVTGLPERVSVIPHALDIERIVTAVDSADRAAIREQFGIRESSAIVSIASRLVERKGLHVFIDTIEAVAAKSGRPVTGLIAGDGPLRPQLESHAASVLCHGEVKFLGFLQDIRPMLAVSDLALFPSEEEMLPVFPVESSAAGVPVVCSDLPGTREVVTDGANGIVVTGGAAGYAAAVLRLLENETERHEMGRCGRATARERFSAGKVSRQLVDLYEKLLSRRGG
jgi:glycosyltransferase involved in cell wall biosynthesis